MNRRYHLDKGKKNRRINRGLKKKKVPTQSKKEGGGGGGVDLWDDAARRSYKITSKRS